MDGEIPVTVAAAPPPSGNVVEWGGTNATHTGSYTHVRSAFLSTCALDDSGDLACWGKSISNPAKLCISHETGSSECFDNPGGSVNDYGPFTDFDFAYLGGCALNTDKEVVCWTESYSSWAAVNTFPSDLGLAEKIETSQSGYSCIIGSNDKATCWGAADTPPDTEWEDIVISDGDGFMEPLLGCGIRMDNNQVDCWKTNAAFFDPETLGAVKQLDIGRGSACGIQVSDDVVNCIGSGHSVDHLPAGLQASMVIVGTGAPNATCAIRNSDQNVQCWGGDQGQTNEPAGAVADLSAGQNFVSAVFIQ